MFSIYITFFILQGSHHFTIFTATIIISLLYCNIAWIGIVLAVGNIVYPVNGIDTVKSDNLSYSMLQVYSRMHLSELSLGLLTISLAHSSNSLLIQILGYLVGVLQMTSTYYSNAIKYKFYIVSITIWNIWIILFQLSCTSLIHLF